MWKKPAILLSLRYHFHSDRGSQYASYDVLQFLSDNGFIQSMNRNGNCYDNAIFVKKQN